MKRVLRLALIVFAAAALALAVFVLTGRTEPEWLGKRLRGG